MANVSKTLVVEAKKAEEGQEYVEIPEKDCYGEPVQAFQINRDKYPPGKHLVSTSVAAELKRLLANHSVQTSRRLRSQSDKTVYGAM